MPTTSNLKEIARLGGGISLDASTFTTANLKEIARVINESGATLIIRKADSKTTANLKEIAALAPGKVIFEF